MLVGLITGALLILVGTTIWRVTAAAASGRLRRNGWVGIRLGSTGASDAAWLAGHRAALSSSRTTGIVSLVIGLVMIVDGLITRDGEGSILLWMLFVIGYGEVLIATITMAVRAHRAATQVVYQER